MAITSYDIRVIADGLLLARALNGAVTRENVREMLTGPLHVPTLPSLPDWIHVKRYIEHHPAFVQPEHRRQWWRNSDKVPADRRRLVREFAGVLCGAPDATFTALTPRLMRHNGEVFDRVLERFDDIASILNDESRRPSERRMALVSLLGRRKSPTT